MEAGFEVQLQFNPPQYLYHFFGRKHSEIVFVGVTERALQISMLFCFRGVYSMYSNTLLRASPPVTPTP